MAHSQIIISTNFGDITLDLYDEYAPKAVENFVHLAKSGYYDGVIFHRVIRDFMIQWGDPTGTGMWWDSKWNQPFEDEYSDALTHKKGILSMANAWPHTNGSQFFIVTAEDASFLDGKHTIFGKVIDGMDVVEEIQTLPTDHQDRPKMNVIIDTMTFK